MFKKPSEYGWACNESGTRLSFIPDMMFTPANWGVLGNNLLVESMDRRKPTGRTVQEMKQIFDLAPKARFCFDISHARQVDPSMTEAWLLLHAFASRLAEVHVSEVNTSMDSLDPGASGKFQTLLC